MEGLGKEFRPPHLDLTDSGWVRRKSRSRGWGEGSEERGLLHSSRGPGTGMGVWKGEWGDKGTTQSPPLPSSPNGLD